MNTGNEELDSLLIKLGARWKATGGAMGKKTKTLVRRCLWLGANAAQFSEIGMETSMVMPVYEKMPQAFHRARAKALVMKKTKEEQDNG